MHRHISCDYSRYYGNYECLVRRGVADRHSNTICRIGFKRRLRAVSRCSAAGCGGRIKCFHGCAQRIWKIVLPRRRRPDVRSWVLYGGRLLLHVHKLHDHRISLVEAQSISDCGKAAKGGACGCPLVFWYAAVPHCRTRNGHPLTPTTSF